MSEGGYIVLGMVGFLLAFVLLALGPCRRTVDAWKIDPRLFSTLFFLPSIIFSALFLATQGWKSEVIAVLGISLLITSIILLSVSLKRDRKNYQMFTDWLNNIGFGSRKNAPGDEYIWKKAEKNKIAVLVDEKNLMSASFAQSVSKKICDESFLWKTEVETICRQFAPGFQVSVDAVSAIGAIVSVLLRDVKKIYAWGTINDYFFLDDDFLTSFYDVIKDLGMATTSEYTAACRKSEKLKPVLPYMVSVCPVVLEQLAKTEKVRKARIDDGETEAYQAVGVEVGSNMVCTELDIDWDD